MKDKNKKLWFRAKRFGWGWYPITWQGWLIVLGFVVIMTLNGFRINSISQSVTEEFINYASQTIILVGILIVICYLNGEKPRWTWGNE
jgi:hypothetical protein